MGLLARIRGIAWRRWSKRLLKVSFLAAAVVTALAWTGVLESWARSAVLRRVEQMTGGRAELQSFRFETLALRATLGGFTLRGREPEGAPPFFHADQMVVDARVDSLLRRKVSLDEVRVEKPVVNLVFDAEGRSNAPVPRTAAAPPGRTLDQRLFDLAVKQLRITEGVLNLNGREVPLSVEGGTLALALDYRPLPAPGAPGSFHGELEWKEVKLSLRQFPAFPATVAAKFRVAPDSFVLDEFSLRVLQSQLSGRAALGGYAAPDWTFAYQGQLALGDLRAALRAPQVPDGQVRFDGKGSFSGGQAAVTGSYRAREVHLPYRWFHAGGMEAQGSYSATGKTLTSADFSARALGGLVQGRVELEFAGTKFHTDLRASGLNVAAALSAVDHPGFPVAALRWDGAMDAQAITTWERAFQRLESRGSALWSPPGEARPGMIPATAKLNFHFERQRERVQIAASQISTPQSRIEVSGALGSADSALEARVEARELAAWNDFIRALSGMGADYVPVGGEGEFVGRVTGPLAGPTFAGRAGGAQVTYGQLRWDRVEGDITYSPRELRLARARAQRGGTAARMDLSLALTQWAFRPENPWSLEAELDRAPSDDLQSFIGTSYPARALVSGQFRAGGTRAAPELSALVDLVDLEVYGLHFERARGQVQWDSEEVRLNRAEVRKATGRITGNARYGLRDGRIAFDAAGAVIPLEQVRPLQTEQAPLGGQVSFQLKGNGPAAAPQVEGTLRVVDLRAGHEVLGSFESKVRADGRQLRMELTSAMSEGALSGAVDLTLAGQYPLRGDLTLRAIDLDPFFSSALRLPHESFTGHSRVDGRFLLHGDLLKPDEISVAADISRLTFGYESVQLRNDGPVKLAYRAQEVRIEQAHLKGADTDFEISGFARFNGDRRLDLRLTGLLNLQLLGGFVPDLEARGSARVNTTVEGTTLNPRITGRVRLEEAAAQLGDFPAGLSRIRGDLVFDRSRLLLENVSAEAGGGRLALGGSVTYGEGPLRYDLTIGATRTRIRYPEGMSWLGHGALRFAGTQSAAVLSGRITLERLLLSQGFDFGALLASAPGGARGAGNAASPFVRNLQFDIEVVSAPDARMEWAAARFDCDAQLRVRGTWEHPILLGHIHLLSGEMTFRGNRYALTRGDINFANPFRIDPELNLEAVTTIRQYEVTLNFTGPASRLTLAYRSDPPLPATDVVELLALGRTGDEGELRSGASRSTESGASALLGEAVTSQIGGRIERLFGVSRFRIDPFLAGTGTEQNASARITIEQQVARDLVITYITNVSSTQQQVIQVEYAVNRDVSIIALRDQNGTFGLDVKFKKRFQ